MKYELLSELRTIYETSDEYPHTLRVTMTMKDIVDGDVLKQAVGLIETTSYGLTSLTRFAALQVGCSG